MRSLAKSDLNDPSMPVAVPPGATALTRIPCGPWRKASLLVIPAMACLEVP